MALTLRAQVPFPEQTDIGQSLDIVFPRHENELLYGQLQKLADATSQKLKSTGGITVVIQEIPNHPGMHERLNVHLRTLDRIEVTRKGAELVLSNPKFTAKEAKSPPRQTMADVIAEMRDPAASAPPSTGDTMAANTGKTTPIPRPGKPVVRGLSAEDRAKARPKPENSRLAAEEMLKRLKNRR